MGIVGGGGFHHMRYVMAVFGGAAFALLFLQQDLERVSEFRYHRHYNITTRSTQYIIYTVGFIILVLTGIFSKRLSAKYLMAGVMSIHALHATLCIPLYYHSCFLTLATLTTMASVISPSICFVAMHAMIAKWSPPNERSLMTSIVYSGVAAATAYFVNSAPHSADQEALYIAIFSIVWIILWCIMIDDSPERQNKFISRKEKEFIRTSIETYWPRPSPNEGMEFKRIIFSKAFISVAFVESSNVLILSILIHLLRASTGANPFVEPIEYIGQTIVVLTCGIVTAVCLKRKIISFDLARKIPATIATIIPLPLIILAFTQRWYQVFHICNIISHTVIGAKYSGTLANIIDISPDNASCLMTIVLIINQASMAISYQIVDFVDHNFRQYEDIMVITPITVFVIVSTMLYWFWGSTAQKTTVTVSSDSTAGEIYSYRPVQPPVQQPMKA